MSLSKISALRPSTSQDVAYTGTSATVASGFGAGTYCVRLAATSACRYRVVEAAGGTATATDTFLPANWVDYIIVSPGQKIAAIQSATNGLITATAGTLNITEMV